MQRHQPAAVLVNGAPPAPSLFGTPIRPLSNAPAAGVDALSRLVGIDPSDAAIPFDNATFPEEVWYPSEDKAAYPVQAAIMVVATLACLRMAGRRRAYAVAILAALLMHVVMVKWQPW